VSVHADLNETTRGLFNTERFQKMKRTAVFVNTARGPIVDQKALMRCPEVRHDLRGRAGRDGPGASGCGRSAACALPNVVIAPHIASATVGTRANAMAMICADNLLAGLRGEKLPAFVNPDVQTNRRR